MGTLSERVKMYFKREPDLLIETGTCLGASVSSALAMGFNEVWTVELSSALYLAACQLFEEVPGVWLNHGSSPEFLQACLPMAQDRFVVFWLDAHYSGHDRSTEQDNRYGECPLIAELEAITAIKWTYPPIIVIDDAMMLEAEYWSTGKTRHQFDHSQWPSLAQVKLLLPGYSFDISAEQLYCFPSGGN